MKTVFLDRDGVINKYPGDKKYVTAWRNFKFLPGAKEAIVNLHRNNFKLFIISNQAGVGKGLFTQEALDNVTKNMLSQIESFGGHIDGVYYCVHTPEDNCVCRKPLPGLIHRAKKNRRLNLKNAFFIGDTIIDVNAAKAAGARPILVLSGKEKLSNRRNWESQPDFIFENLYEAAEFIINL